MFPPETLVEAGLLLVLVEALDWFAALTEVTLGLLLVAESLETILARVKARTAKRRVAVDTLFSINLIW